jgi:hypothetical protein
LFSSIRAQPERDHRAINAMLKKVHGCSVAQNMRRDILSVERRAIAFGTMLVTRRSTASRLSLPPHMMGKQADPIRRGIFHRGPICWKH